MRPEDRGAGDDGIRARFDRLSGAFTILPAVGLNNRAESARVVKIAQSTDLRQEFLAAEAGIDRHDENDIAEMEDIFDQLSRIERHARLLAEIVDLREDAVEMDRGG